MKHKIWKPVRVCKMIRHLDNGFCCNYVHIKSCLTHSIVFEVTNCLTVYIINLKMWNWVALTYSVINLYVEMTNSCLVNYLWSKRHCHLGVVRGGGTKEEIGEVVFSSTLQYGFYTVRSFIKWLLSLLSSAPRVGSVEEGTHPKAPFYTTLGNF